MAHLAAQQLRELCRDPLLQRHLPAVSSVGLEDVTRALVEFGRVSFGVADDWLDPADRGMFVCALRWRADEREAVRSSGLTPLLAALRCLQGVLASVDVDSRAGLGELSRMLAED